MCPSGSAVDSPPPFFIVVELTVPWKKHHLVIGKGGVFINQVRCEHQVSVSVPPYKNKSDVIYVSGYHLVRIQSAINTLLAQLVIREEQWKLKMAEEVELGVPVPTVYRGRIIGRHGATIEKLRTQYKVRITLPKVDECDCTDGGNTLLIRGSPDDCLAAKEAILNLTGLADQFVELELAYIAKEHRSQRSVLRLVTTAVQLVKDAHNVRVYYTFYDGRHPKSGVVINATDTSPQGACQAAAVDVCRLWPVTVRVEAPVQHFSRIVGRNGETIRQLRDQHDVVILAPMKKDVVPDVTNYVTLIGRKDHVDAVEPLVRTILNTPQQETQVILFN